MNLSTKYLGLSLRTPLVASSSPLSENIDDLKRLEDAGAPAIVLHRSLKNKSATKRTPLRAIPESAAPRARSRRSTSLKRTSFNPRRIVISAM
jgi:dihydroorotate dehydrogenase (fumarate)